MIRYFTHYWCNTTWEKTRKDSFEGELLDYIAGNLFEKRGVSVGDVVYVVTVKEGKLYLSGKLVVGKVCKVDEASSILGCKPEDLWEANNHIVADVATLMYFDLQVSINLTRQLKFIISGGGTKPLKFVPPDYLDLDKQTLRGVRKLEPASAAKLDTLLPEPKKTIVENKSRESLPFNEEVLPEEIIDVQTCYEGAKRQIIVNVYERNAKARKVCMAHYGLDCFVCGFNFKSFYGEVGNGFIQVHHLKPLSEVGEEYVLDPIKDLRPVCANCHAMIHRKNPAYSIEEMKELLK